MKIDRQSRPFLCPCPQSCRPICNGMAADERVKTGDLTEGYSGDCIGQGDMSEYVVGGNVHRNDMNQCIFTPLKGIIRYNINEGDVDAMLQMCQRVLSQLHPERVCDECGTKAWWTHWIVSGERRLCCHCYAKVGVVQGQTETIPNQILQDGTTED